ncbi:single-stranded DNA-binding protein [Desulfurispora thermophila]|uniref:single-stranded DNA-binding protein n=1 Tax=Desulfurispora thermophila TaxID=265470 RepID=UPI00036377D9
MYNKVILAGRLVADPEMRYTPNGMAVCQFRLAVDRPFNNRQGERETDFIDIIAWHKLAELCQNYLKKGRLTLVEGRLQIRSYDDKQGIRRRAAEVIASDVRFIDRAPTAGGSAPAAPEATMPGAGYGGPGAPAWGTMPGGPPAGNWPAQPGSTAPGVPPQPAWGGPAKSPADDLEHFSTEVSYNDDDLPF